MKLKSLLFFTALTGLLAGCTAPVKVDSDYDTDIDFSQYQTYSWRQPNQHNDSTVAYLGNDLMDKRIRSAIDNELKEKGFIKTDSGDVDFLVNYTVSTKEKTDVKTYNTYSGFSPGFYGGYYGRGPYYYSGVGVGFGTNTSNTTVNHWQQGTLLIDIIEPGKDQLVWRGSGQGRLPENTTQQEKEDIVDSVVGQVLRSFPPQP